MAERKEDRERKHKRAFELHKDGLSNVVIGERLNMNFSRVSQVLKKAKETEKVKDNFSN